MGTMARSRRALLLVETAGSIVWFAMDASWMLNLRIAAVVLAVPTVLLNVLVVPFSPRGWPSWLVSGAMASWACMNVVWMTHDMKLTTWGLAGAKGFLALGVLLLAGALFLGRADATQVLLTRFRRLRLRA